MEKKLITWFSLAVLVPLIVSCGRNSGDGQSQDIAEARDGGGADEAATPDASDPQLKEMPEAILPQVGGDADCDKSLEPPTLCEWAESVDTVALCEILAVELNTHEFQMGAGGDAKVVDTCPGLWSNSLIIECRTLDVLSGENPGSSVAVRIGSRQLRNWVPAVRSEGEDWTWRNTDPSEAPLQVGSVLGVALTEVPEWGYWSLMGEAPFTVTDSNEVVFPQIDPCERYLPPDVGLDLGSFVNELSGCADRGSQLKANRLAYHAEPEDTFAAHCSEVGAYEAPEPCVSDEDCDENGNAECTASGICICLSDDACADDERCLDGQCSMP